MSNKTNTAKSTFSLSINDEVYEGLIESEYTKKLIQHLTYSEYYDSLNEKLRVKEYRALVSVAELHIKLCQTMSKCEYTLSDIQCLSLVYGILKDMIDMYKHSNDIRLITRCNSSLRELIDVTYKNVNNFPLDLRVTSFEFPKDLRLNFNKFNPGAHGNIIESVRSLHDMYMTVDLCVMYLNNKLTKR